MNTLRSISITALLFTICGLFFQCQKKEAGSPPFVTGKGTGINSVTLMVKNIDSAINYYRDTLGFNIMSTPKAGVFPGTKTAAMYLGDLSAFEFLSTDSVVSQDSVTPFIKSFLDSRQGMRFLSVHTSNIDSTHKSLSRIGFQLDSIQEYQSSLEQPEGWSNDSPKRKSLDFNAANPPAHLPRFIENVGYDYDEVRKDWITYYVYRRLYNTHPNGVVGIKAVRILVDDLKTSTEEYEKMGFELVEKSDLVVRFKLYKNHEIHLLEAKSQAQKDFLANRGQGIYAIRFDVVNIDSTKQFFKNKQPSKALFTSAADTLLVVSPTNAFGIQLEFTKESEAQSILTRTYTPAEKLDTLAVIHATYMYNKYCALCHGDNREGYAADYAPSLRSKSLLRTSMNTSFMRYAIEYGRANTAMAGFAKSQGGPLETVEITLLLKWLNDMADVKEPIKLSKEPIMGDVALGSAIYDKQCASCHGTNGEGISGPALGNPLTLATSSDHFLRYAIAEGRDGTPMMAFKDVLSDKEIDGVVAFLRSRASGWDIPEPIAIEKPTPDQYILNPEGDSPIFSLREEKYVSAEQVNTALKNGNRMIILDARAESDWRKMHIPGAVPVPFYEEPENFIDDIPNDGTQIVIYCACPHAASGRVQSTLKRYGFKNTAIIDEGVLFWAQKGYPVRGGN
jgi:mono/diheme cytochrome c family protein/rhodanese-related sulfurtransferase/catechol 2,3-dioxygenase-like lactoylglutathione lyase family enzyme